MTPGTHGSTFGGNLLGMAVCNSVLDVVSEPGFLNHVQHVAHQLKQGLLTILETYPDVICSVQGKGLMIGVQCIVPQNDVITALENEYILSVGAGNNFVRFLPPLIITEEEIREGLHRIEKAIAHLSNS
ncbi:acetylornithine/N-succinyldiaminopimelate aminotransferase [Bartonella schoenbuchensis R1]|nr:acetylornithine/N-succinyldiaminopimelate aminotransferase [Bartonella schoenbuchensis R1]